MALAPGSSNELEIEGAMVTDIGCVRASNEDAVAFVLPAKTDPASRQGCLALVADGMGGHAAGEVASALAIDTVRRVFYASQGPAASSLKAAFEAAHRAVLDHASRHSECRGMGTTCTAFAIRGDQAFLAHVGDSRAYLLRAGRLAKLSEDQTLHAQLIREGALTEEEARLAAGGNILLQAIGSRGAGDLIIQERTVSLHAGDILILCSDGLWNMLDDATIARLAAAVPPQEACQNLARAAIAAGGHDNVSVGVFRVYTHGQGQASQNKQKDTRPITIGSPRTRDAVSRRAAPSAQGSPEGSL